MAGEALRADEQQQVSRAAEKAAAAAEGHSGRAARLRRASRRGRARTRKLEHGHGRGHPSSVTTTNGDERKGKKGESAEELTV